MSYTKNQIIEAILHIAPVNPSFTGFKNVFVFGTTESKIAYLFLTNETEVLDIISKINTVQSVQFNSKLIEIGTTGFKLRGYQVEAEDGLVNVFYNRSPLFRFVRTIKGIGECNYYNISLDSWKAFLQACNNKKQAYVKRKVVRTMENRSLELVVKALSTKPVQVETETEIETAIIEQPKSIKTEKILEALEIAVATTEVPKTKTKSKGTGKPAKSTKISKTELIEYFEQTTV